MRTFCVQDSHAQPPLAWYR